jgi:hypothetical protein
MQVCRRFPEIAVLALLGAAFVQQASAQAAQPAPPASSVQLSPFTTSDQTASAGVPSGWKVVSGSETVIKMTGPQNEAINLGSVFIARNGAFQAGQKGFNGADLTMPYNAPLTQKLIMIYQQGAALTGQPAPQITFTSVTPLQVPAILGQCGRFVAALTGPPEPEKIMGIFCSFPIDSGGAFKNFIVVAQAPASGAAQEAPVAQAVFSSYRIPQVMLAKKLAPFTAPPPVMVGGGGNGGLGAAQSATVMATCFDESILRDYGPRQLPRECGGLAPNP